MNDERPGWLARVRKRRLSAESTPLQEDLRRLGLVLIGAGLLAALLQDAPIGFLAVVGGVLLSYLGLTEKGE